MKISLTTKILLGFIINALVVVALLIIYLVRTNVARYTLVSNTLDSLEVTLLIFAFVLLVVVFFILRTQIKLRNEGDKLLLANRELILSIINNTSNPISIKKINGEYLMVNQRFISLFQLEDGKIIGKIDQDLLPKEVADEYRHADLEVIKEGKEIKVEEKIIELDGEHTYLAVKFPLFDAAGRIYAIGSIGTDITDRKTIEKSLRDADTFFKMSPDVMVIANQEKFLKVNPSLSALLGYSNKEILEKPFIEFVYPPDHENTAQEIKKLISGVSPVNFANRWVTADKKIVWLSWTATSEKETGLIYAIARDVTAMRITQEDFKTANTFFDLSHDLMVVIKGEYLVKVNAAFTRILGYKQEDMDDKPFLSFVHPDDVQSVKEMLAKVKKGKLVLNFRVRVKTEEEKYTVLEWTATADPETEDIYAVVREVNELIKKEDALQMVSDFFDTSEGMFLVTEQTKIIKINAAFTKVTGYTLEDLKDLSTLDLIHTDFKKIAVERMKNRKNGEEVLKSARYPFLIKNGEYKWLEALWTIDAETGFTYAVFWDVDDMVKNEDFLKIGNTFYNMTKYIMVIFMEEKFVRVNPATNNILGYTENELLAKPFISFIHPEDADNMLMELKKLNKEVTIIDFQNRWVSKDRGVKWISWTFTFDPATNLIYGVGSEVTDRIKLEQEEKEIAEQLRENELKLRLIIDNISDGVIVANADRKILLSNQHANDLMGENGERSADLSNKFDILDPSDEDVFPAQHLPMARAFNGVATDDIDVVLVNRETKEKRRVLISGRPLADQNNKVIAAVITIKDISKYRQLGEKLTSSIGFKKESQKT